jgi:hypothetical protein
MVNSVRKVRRKTLLNAGARHFQLAPSSVNMVQTISATHMECVSGALSNRQGLVGTKWVRTEAQIRSNRPVFLMLFCLTAGCPQKLMAVSLNLAHSRIDWCITQCLQVIGEPLGRFFPISEAKIRCNTTFENHLEAFSIINASPAFIRQASRHQNEYYSGKFKRHCVKVQAFVTADEQCVHLSKVCDSWTHNKAIIDGLDCQKSFPITHLGPLPHISGSLWVISALLESPELLGTTTSLQKSATREIYAGTKDIQPHPLARLPSRRTLFRKMESLIRHLPWSL